MDPYASSLAILSAMITPVVLISACGALITATSARLLSVVGQVNDYAGRFEAVKREQADGPDAATIDATRNLIIDQLVRTTTRARLLQNSMVLLYVALATFVATSVAIAQARRTNGN